MSDILVVKREIYNKLPSLIQRMFMMLVEEGQAVLVE